MKKYITAIAILIFSFGYSQQKTYCNPINLDYSYCPIPDFVKQGKHRATADPVITYFQDKYYLFSTSQWGYWHSDNMIDWTFIPRKFLRPEHKVYDELCAPSVSFVNDTGIVQNFVPLRSAPKIKGEGRNVCFKWQQEPNADGYIIYFGKSPEKLYGSIMVYGKNEYYFSGLDRSDAYYFRI